MMKASVPLIKAGADPIGVSKTGEWETLHKMLVDPKSQRGKTDIGRSFTNGMLPK